MLAKTDFYSVSVRRIAFTTAVPAVAVHTVYRRKLREYLHGVTLRHWDEAIRTAGAGALRDILQLGDEGEMDDAVTREVSFMHLPSESCAFRGPQIWPTLPEVHREGSADGLDCSNTIARCQQCARRTICPGGYRAELASCGSPSKTGESYYRITVSKSIMASSMPLEPHRGGLLIIRYTSPSVRSDQQRLYRHNQLVSSYPRAT